MSSEQDFYWLFYTMMGFVTCVLGGITFWAISLDKKTAKPKPPKELLYL